MKKSMVSMFLLLCSVVLVGCAGNPEQVYLDELEGQLTHLAELGDNLSTLGDQLADENFNQAFTTLTLLQDDIDKFNLPVYAGSESILLTASQELTNVVDQTSLLTTVLQPVLQKAAENDGWSASQEDLDALRSAEEITTKIEMHMTAAGDAIDAYSE